MDKMATKFAAQGLGIPTPVPHILDARDVVCPLPYPVIIKPVHEGSTVGLFVCRNDEEWSWARRVIDEGYAGGDRRVYMIEACVCGAGGSKARELTVGVLDGEPLPIIEIKPADGLYDYEAKYTRNDTQYVLDPVLPGGLTERLKERTVALFRKMGLRHVSRADYMVDAAGEGWFLEINTLPGFTDHSLVPKAAAHAGLAMPELCVKLAEMTLRDGKGGKGAAAAESPSAAAVAAAQDTGDVEQGEG